VRVINLDLENSNLKNALFTRRIFCLLFVVSTAAVGV